MLGTLKFQLTTPSLIKPKCDGKFSCYVRRFNLRLDNRRLMCLSLQQSQPSDESSHLTSTVGSSSSSSSSSRSSSPAIHLSQWTLTHRHIHILNFIACATAISATWLFCSAIPTLLAFRRAAESMEKLMDVATEELPDTMAAVRLSGMEISDLTTELSDLGQEITQGVRSSTRAVRVAEERLRRLTSMTQPAPMQEVAPMDAKAEGPVLARTARGMREGIVKGRAMWRMFFTVAHFSRIVFNFFKTRAKA